MKKILLGLLLGIFLIGMTACGSMTDEKDIATRFKTSVFLGDSITEGFVINEILPKKCVIAGAGATAGFSYDDVDALVKKKPDNVFIMLGSDDILMPVDAPKALFKRDLAKLVNKIKRELPNAEIYLQSITPVTRETSKQEPRYKRIGEYNELLREMAGELSVHFVDIGALAKKNPDLFAEDGVHFKKRFYRLWLEQLARSL